MSGGPPHRPHNRQVPAANTAWNHLQVPNYFPRQPQLAHMSNEHSLLHQPTWHTPTTTEAMKILPHTHMLSEMLKSDPVFRRDCVDLSLTRNGNQNGELPATPISLSVRDTNKINSLPPSVLDVQAVELTKCTSPSVKSVSPGLKSSSPGLKSATPGLKSTSPGLKSSSPGLKTSNPGIKSVSPVHKPISPCLSSAVIPPAVGASAEAAKNLKRSNVRVDSILERLNPAAEKVGKESSKLEQTVDKSFTEKVTAQSQSVIVQAVSSYDENSNSSGIANVPTPTNPKEDDTSSMHSNEDSLDSNKSRRKRKPSKTIRVSKEEEGKSEKPLEDEVDGGLTAGPQKETDSEKDPLSISKILEDNKIPERRRSSDEMDPLIPAKTRRKTSSESETIDNIAAMVQEGLKDKQKSASRTTNDEAVIQTKPISVSVIKTKDNLKETLTSEVEITDIITTPSTSSNAIVTSLITPAQKKASNTHFVEVENKLEEMFAGIEDTSDPLTTDPLKTDPLKTDGLDLGDKLDDSLLKLDDILPSTSQESTLKTGTVSKKKKPSPKKRRRRPPVSRRSSEVSLETTPKTQRFTRTKSFGSKSNITIKSKKPVSPPKPTPAKLDAVKDIYAYDSSSNTSSSRSKGPFIQIRGPRDSPISVNVVNTPTNDEDGEKKHNKAKKFHDDSEYRHKVRSKGLHCSTLSTKYDAQTKDATWICAFCKRGPHASELTGPSSNGKIIPPGDLFGPYVITTQCPEFERRLDDPYDKQFKSKKITKVLEENLSAKFSKKVKRKHSELDRKSTDDQSDVYLGITETGNNTYEVWVHEDCVVWSLGVYLVGPKIIGLEEAVWTSCNVPCKSCHLKGANISCLRRGCLNIMHLCCARQSNWQFDEDNFKAYCPQHKVP